MYLIRVTCSGLSGSNGGANGLGGGHSGSRVRVIGKEVENKTKERPVDIVAATAVTFLIVTLYQVPQIVILVRTTRIAPFECQSIA